jgi:hypothetical protein
MGQAEKQKDSVGSLVEQVFTRLNREKKLLTHKRLYVLNHCLTRVALDNLKVKQYERPELSL